MKSTLLEDLNEEDYMSIVNYKETGEYYNSLNINNLSIQDVYLGIKKEKVEENKNILPTKSNINENEILRRDYTTNMTPQNNKIAYNINYDGNKTNINTLINKDIEGRNSQFTKINTYTSTISKKPELIRDMILNKSNKESNEELVNKLVSSKRKINDITNKINDKVINSINDSIINSKHQFKELDSISTDIIYGENNKMIPAFLKRKRK